MVPVVREEFDKEAPILAKFDAPHEWSLAVVEDRIQRVKRAPLDELPDLQTTLLMARMPLLLRRLMWAISLNHGPLRGENLGTFWGTSIPSIGGDIVVLQLPGPNVITYGRLHAHHTMDVLLHFDHRVYDGVVCGRPLRRLEEVLNGDIADELMMNTMDTAVR